jgi:hypothetical protein
MVGREYFCSFSDALVEAPPFMDHDDCVQVGLMEVFGGIAVNCTFGWDVVVFVARMGDSRAEIRVIETEPK